MTTIGPHDGSRHDAVRGTGPSAGVLPVPARSGRPLMPTAMPPQTLVRICLLAIGAALLVVGHVQGLAVGVAWLLIVIALASELAASVVWWQRRRRALDTD